MRQLEFKRVSGHGGKRRGAGRPSRTGQPGHAKRPTIKLEHPMHVTLRLKALPVNLRCGVVFTKFKRAIVRARAFVLYVNQFAILGNHLHLIVEAADNECLTRGMRSLAGALGKLVRRIVGGRGAVFAGRFHLHQLKSPREYRHALKYVLLNHSQHANLIPAPDDFSSGPKFRQWGKLLGDLTNTLLAGLDDYPLKDYDHLAPPRSWLGRLGWRRGLPSRA